MAEITRKTSATSEPPPPTLPPGPSRFKSWPEFFTAEWHWLLDTFSRDRIISFLKTLIWVAPLTLLIWIYAEREQVHTTEDEPIPFELVSNDSSRIVSLKGGDRNLMVDLQGPRARVLEVLEKIRGGAFPQGIRIEPDPALSANDEHDIPTKPLLQNNSIFRDSGITVLSVRPSRLTVVIDEQAEVEARVMAAPEVTNLLPTTTFNPPVVKVRGPKSLLDKARQAAEQDGGQVVVYAQVGGLEALKTPGEKRVAGIPIEPPRALQDERVTIVPTEVDAVLHVRENDDQLTYDSITVQAILPRGLDNKYTPVYDASLANVTVVGPKDQIDLLRQPGAPRPLAVFRVSDQDVGDPRAKRVMYLYEGLPPDIRISEKDRDRTIEFELRPRGPVE
jgi:hypothetical protein